MLVAAIVTAAVAGCGAEGATVAPPSAAYASGGGGTELSVAATGGGGGSCVDLVLTTEREARPVDIIFMIDNSGSMIEEIEAVEQNINANFAEIFDAAGADFRVIMITRHGAEQVFGMPVCIEPPLSGTANCHGPPVFVPGRFYHYDVHVDSYDSLCRAFGTMFGAEPDEWGLGPSGWNEWLRPEALKVFIEISDESMGCVHYGTGLYGEPGALAFESRLFQTNPAQFGTAAAPNFVFYSIVGLAGGLEPLSPDEDLVTEVCEGALSAGAGYQLLSKRSGGLRFPVCDHQSYDAVFQHLASSVVDVTSIPCELEVASPMNETLDLSTLYILFTAGSGESSVWTRVDDESQCTPGAFYVDETVSPIAVHLCPETCALVEADEQASLEVKIACGAVAR